ncbi:MAG: glycosyltransferase [Gemmatimonadota bacterium]|nr:MAG: glycosyltransferase [Gemmatimonadota bacterium]
MKKVLILAYHFPPEGGPAVQRVLKFVKYLPRYDYCPLVLSAKHPLKTIDPTLVDDIPAQTSLFQAKDWGAYVPHDIKKFIKRMYIPDNQAMWKYTAVKKGIEIISRESVPLLFSSSPPHSVQVIAKEIAQRTGVPWIADFRDEWTFDPNFHSSSFKKTQAEMEREVLHECSAITTVQNNARENFCKTTDRKKIFVIRNGFDPDDFGAIEHRTQMNPERLILAYSGRFTVKSSPESFFQALDSVCNHDHTIKQLIGIRIIGKSGNKEWIKKYPILHEIAEFIPYQPHKKCLSMLNQADALLLLANNLKHADVLPAKMYEYFYLKKPIFAVTSYPGELTSLLKEYGNAYIGYDTNIKTIEDSILKLLSDWQNDTMRESVTGNFVNRFHRERLTQYLAALFDRVIDSSHN